MKRWNSKGQLESALLAVVMIFVIGLVIFLFSHVFDSMYTQLDNYFNSTTKYNVSEARTAIQDIQNAERSSWDYATIAIVIGLIIQLIVLSYATRISIVFYWLYIISSLIILTVGAVLSTTWDNLVANPAFVDTIARFPITDAILGSRFMLITSSLIIMTAVIVIFGKRPGEETQ